MKAYKLCKRKTFVDLRSIVGVCKIKAILLLFSQIISYLEFQDGVNVVDVKKVNTHAKQQMKDPDPDPEVQNAIEQIQQFCKEAESQLAARDLRVSDTGRATDTGQSSSQAADTKQTFFTQQQHASNASNMNQSYSSGPDSDCNSEISGSDSEDDFEQPPIKIPKKNWKVYIFINSQLDANIFWKWT